MSNQLLDVFTLVPETLEKMMLFPPTATARGHLAEVGGPENRGSPLALPVDILESSAEYTFLLDVPGLSKSQLQVTVEEERVLVISTGGKRKREEGEEEGKYLRMERRRPPQKLMRKFRLAEDADVSAVAAKCDNGVLRVSVKKLPPPPKPKTVQIAVS